MHTQSEATAAKNQIDQLIAAFFRAVSFEQGAKPAYHQLHALFIEHGLLVKNSGRVPEICSVTQFIELREQLLESGELASFKEWEWSESTAVWGNIAQRWSIYEKAGTLHGAPFHARGVITTQCIATPEGWKISAMAWDDERPGLALQE